MWSDSDRNLFCDEKVEYLASQIIINEESHCVTNYEYPQKSPCQLYLIAKKFLILHPRQINCSSLVFSMRSYKRLLKTVKTYKNIVKTGELFHRNQVERVSYREITFSFSKFFEKCL